MIETPQAPELEKHGATRDQARDLADQLSSFAAEPNAATRWRGMLHVLSPSLAPTLHRYLFDWNYARWSEQTGSAPPMWFPDDRIANESNIGRLLREEHLASLDELAQLSRESHERFWGCWSND